jgi:hypothetical protein
MGRPKDEDHPRRLNDVENQTVRVEASRGTGAANQEGQIFGHKLGCGAVTTLLAKRKSQRNVTTVARIWCGEGAVNSENDPM